MKTLICFLLLISCVTAQAGHRRARHLVFSSKALGAVVSFFAPAISGASDGSAVQTWNDLSGNAYNATQATQANRPIYKTAISGGMPVLRFNGSSNWLATSSFVIATSATVLLVYSRPWTVRTDYRKAFAHGVNDSVNAGLAIGTHAYATAIDWLAGDTLSFLGYQNATQARCVGPAPSALANNQFVVYSTTLSSALAQHWFNGQIGTNRVTRAAALPSENTPLYIGANFGGSGFGQAWDGDIAAEMAFNGAIGEALRSRIQNSFGFVFKIAQSQ